MRIYDFTSHATISPLAVSGFAHYADLAVGHPTDGAGLFRPKSVIRCPVLAGYGCGNTVAVRGAMAEMGSSNTGRFGSIGKMAGLPTRRLQRGYYHPDRSFLEIIFLAFVAAMILRAIFTQGSISLDSIFGAICVYLLVGMAWGSLYSMTEVLNPGSFQATGKLADTLNSAETRQPVLIYYSFVTMTTVGYGDITPVSPPARTLSWLEAMMGQFYIAVLVAFLVGIRVSQGPVKRNNGSSP